MPAAKYVGVIGDSTHATRAAEKVIRSQSCSFLLVGVVDQ